MTAKCSTIPLCALVEQSQELRKARCSQSLQPETPPSTVHRSPSSKLTPIDPVNEAVGYTILSHVTFYCNHFVDPNLRVQPLPETLLPLFTDHSQSPRLPLRTMRQWVSLSHVTHCHNHFHNPNSSPETLLPLCTDHNLQDCPYGPSD